jgi:hypothetical protein
LDSYYYSCYFYLYYIIYIVTVIAITLNNCKFNNIQNSKGKVIVNRNSFTLPLNNKLSITTLRNTNGVQELALNDVRGMINTNIIITIPFQNNILLMSESTIKFYDSNVNLFIPNSIVSGFTPDIATILNKKISNILELYLPKTILQHIKNVEL